MKDSFCLFIFFCNFYLQYSSSFFKNISYNYIRQKIKMLNI
ncbi:hypothetical protein HMPREF1984_00932 [Leptotrichia sp. oral taxon 215 str. W9775]|nr:hypothetical protein HMPREF1984_00932 [Leptotrichia sp. oral taxon 215 str. W9775]